MNPLAGPILLVGELCPDIVVAGVPTTGTSLRFGQAEDLVSRTTMTLGSSAGITACAATAAGEQVRLLAVSGDDEFGAACRRWLKERGVDTSAVRVDPRQHTGSSVILVRSDDPIDREILTDLGAMTALRAEDVTDDLLATSRHLHISSFFLHHGARDRLHTRMARARELGLTVSLDTNDDPDRAWASGASEAIAQTDLLFVNESEARGLAGAGDDAPAETAVRALLARMPVPGNPIGDRDPRFPAVVLKLGAAGAAVHTHRESWHIPAPSVTVVDTVGAGDTLAGTCLARLLAGDDWPTALSLGVAAASLSTQAAGGTAGQCPLDEVRGLAAILTAGPTRSPDPEKTR